MLESMLPVDLHTAQLSLSCPTNADADAIYHACQDAEIQERIPVPVPYTRDSAAQFIEYCRDGWVSGDHLAWAMFPLASHELVGMISLDPIHNGQGRIGFWLAPDARRQGFLSESVHAVADFAFESLGLVRLEWNAIAGNLRSARAAQRNGFHFEGVRRNGTRDRSGWANEWLGSLLPTDDRSPVSWPILTESADRS